MKQEMRKFYGRSCGHNNHRRYHQSSVSKYNPEKGRESGNSMYKADQQMRGPVQVRGGDKQEDQYEEEDTFLALL